VLARIGIASFLEELKPLALNFGVSNIRNILLNLLRELLSFWGQRTF